jgi:ribulose-phosphate 3-epimerase
MTADRSIEVSVSILCADFARMADEIRKCEDAGVDRLHIDVMDGHFVPNITIGPVIVEAIRPLTKLPIEAHLMIEDPGMYLEQFIKAGADILAIHAECYGRRRESCREYGQFPKEVDTIDMTALKKDVRRIKERGKKAFVAINPGTPLCVQEMLNDLDGVLIMSVNPGFAKQKFMPSVLPKLQELRQMFEGAIAVDGGINELTAPQAVKAGADILATASYFFQAANPQELVKSLKALGR